jgi:molybdopterin synthase catalytic subunit
MIEITMNILSPSAISDALIKSTNGACVTFVGTVRSPSQGREVLFLEYEAYPEMAEKKLHQVVDEVKGRWRLEDVSISHRVGRVAVGEAALVVAVAAPHRKEAFEACEYAVDRVKQLVPVWKKEFYTDGESWVENQK